MSHTYQENDYDNNLKEYYLTHREGAYNNPNIYDNENACLFQYVKHNLTMESPFKEYHKKNLDELLKIYKMGHYIQLYNSLGLDLFYIDYDSFTKKYKTRIQIILELYFNS